MKLTLLTAGLVLAVVPAWVCGQEVQGDLTTLRFGTNFTNFETPQVHPVDLSPDGRWLAVCNTANAEINFFDVTEFRPVLAFSVPVGLDPVSVRFRNAEEVWAVSHISDQVSVISMEDGSVERVINAGDEPCDVVFAGRPQRAYVSCSQENALEVYTLDPFKETPRVVPLQGEEPRALAVSADGMKVHVAFFESGNGTTILAGGFVKDDMISFPPDLVSHEETPYGGANPVPYSQYIAKFPLREAINRNTAPPTGMIVKLQADGRWLDENEADWTEFVSGEKAAMSGREPGWRLIDHEVATVDVNDYSVSYRGGTMNICMGLAENPATGALTVIGTDAMNHIRYEPVLNGIFVRVNLALIDPQGEMPQVLDLNPHLDYLTPTVPKSIREQSIGDPRGILWAPDGKRGYVTGRGSDNLVVIGADGKRLPEQAAIPIGAGPTGMALSQDGDRLFVLNQFGASVSVIDTKRLEETSRTPFPDSTPELVKEGRRHLYNTHHSSGLGQVSCGSCHVDGRMDRLAWDLGVPDGKPLKVHKKAEILGDPVNRDQHPMKGPMVTQTFQDIVDKGPFHWRGDRARFEDFRPTFQDLMGREEELSLEDMRVFKDYLRTIHFPPNPFRNEDNSLPRDLPLPGFVTTGRFGEAGEPLPNGNASRGLDLFRQRPHPKMNSLTCFSCHQQTSGIGVGLPMEGTNFNELAHAVSSLTGAGQGPFKVVQLRNLYDKQGFNLSTNASLNGFGFLHDGSVDTLPQFVAQGMFDVQSVQEVADITALLMSFSGNEASTAERGHWSGQTPSVETHTLTGKQENYRAKEFPIGPTAMLDRLKPLMKFVEEENTISLIARGRMNGEARSWIMWESEVEETKGSPPGRTIKLPPPKGNGNYDSVKFDADMMNTTHKIKDLLHVAEQLTFTVVPQGSDAFRLSIDRDRDGLLNRDETRDLDLLREGHQNPFDPNREDATGDGYRLTPDGVIDAFNDFDSDGTLNIVEIDEGTNPLEGWKEESDQMNPVLSTGSKTGTLVLSWNARPQALYHVEASLDLEDWKVLNDDPIETGLREDRMHHQIQPRNDLQRRYYRVREESPES